MSYKKPVLTEILFEAYFETPIDANKQFKLIEDFRNEFDDVEASPDLGNVQTGVSNVQIQKSMPMRIRLWRNKKRELFQVFHNKIAFNYLPFNEDKNDEYQGWDFFLEKSMNIIGSVITNNDDLSFKIFSLCYVDNILANDNDFSLGKFINCDGDIFSKECSPINKALDFVIGCGNFLNESNQQVRLKLSVLNENDYTINLNTKFSDLLTNCSVEDSKELLEKLHQLCLTFFERVITDYTKNNIMEGLV